MGVAVAGGAGMGVPVGGGCCTACVLVGVGVSATVLPAAQALKSRAVSTRATAAQARGPFLKTSEIGEGGGPPLSDAGLATLCKVRRLDKGGGDQCFTDFLLFLAMGLEM